ncbi:MAG: hypothetical protein FWF86_08325, partial [Clostridia bacterium]|nr:hypothetical protein [Clostridia bacterium]
YARIVEGVEEAGRLRHDLRQMFTAMQGMNEPGKEKELEAYCLDILAQLPRADGGQEVNRCDGI